MKRRIKTGVYECSRLVTDYVTYTDVKIIVNDGRIQSVKYKQTIGGGARATTLTFSQWGTTTI